MPWHYRDLTSATAGPAAITGTCAYIFNQQDTQHVDYAGGDGHIHELWWDSNGWYHNDLTNASGAPALSGESRANGPGGYMFAAQGTQHVVFVGEENESGGHIHELWWNNNGWHHHDLSDATAAPLSINVPPGGYVFDSQGTQHVDYVGNDSHIHELWWDEDGWHHHDLTKASGAPAAASQSPAGYASFGGNTQHVNYLGTDGFIHELKWKSGNWKHTNLSGLTGAPASLIAPSAYAFAIGDTHHVNYIGIDGHIHELWFDGSWHWDDLSIATGAAPGSGVLCAYPFPVTCTRHLAFTNAEGRIHHLWWDAGVWHHEDLSNTGAPLSDFAPLSGYAFNSRRTQHVIYAEIEDLHVYELWWQARDIPIAEIPRPAETR
jgi:hypothetical protein